MIKLGQMVLKGVNLVHNDKSGQMVFKEVNWVHNTKNRSYGLQKSQLGTYTMIKLGQMVLKGVNLVHNIEKQVIWS